MIFALVSFSLASCLKAVNTNVNGENLTTNFLQLEYVQDSFQTNINSGLQYFSGSTLLFPPTDAVDTINFQVTYNGPTPAASDLTVTLASDWTAINDNFSNDGITYEKMPDSLYKIITTTVTIKAGKRDGYAKMVVYPSKIDPTKSYMAPIAPSATGTDVSKNFGHIYFHTIGIQWQDLIPGISTDIMELVLREFRQVFQLAIMEVLSLAQVFHSCQSIQPIYMCLLDIMCNRII